MYGCETRSVKLKKEHRLRMCKNRVLRNIFGPNMGYSNIYLLQLGCHPVAVVILHVDKT